MSGAEIVFGVATCVAAFFSVREGIHNWRQSRKERRMRKKNIRLEDSVKKSIHDVSTRYNRGFERHRDGETALLSSP